MNELKKLSDRCLVVVLDGFGINPNETKNAIKDANTPNLDKLFKEYPFTTIEAGGEKVGLPAGVSGNSEVGHMNLGAGRPVRQDLVRINESIANGSFSTLPKLIELIDTAKSKTNRIHILGLLSDGGVHSHINHIKESIKAISNENVEVYFHAFMDGRDTSPTVGEKYIHELNEVSGFKFASMQGRSIGMDRDRRWEKIKSAYDTFLGKGATTNKSPVEWLQKEYSEGRNDEFIHPVLFNSDYAIKEGDCCFFVNFRPDRAIQLTMAFNLPEFKEFEREFIPPYFLCMTPYLPDELDLPILFDKEKITGGLSQYLSTIELKQFKIAETEKYAHVTYFFNGGEKKPFPGEEQVLIPSPRDIATYDQKPEMNAHLVTERLLKALEDKEYKFYLVNYANADMVGHTGKYEAVIKAVETLDDCVSKLVQKCLDEDVAVIITADHGNADQMVYEDDSPHTSHTGALVPFSLIHSSLKGVSLEQKVKDPALMNIAPTVLKIIGIKSPSSFTGQSVY